MQLVLADGGDWLLGFGGGGNKGWELQGFSGVLHGYGPVGLYSVIKRDCKF